MVVTVVAAAAAAAPIPCCTLSNGPVRGCHSLPLIAGTGLRGAGI